MCIVFMECSRAEYNELIPLGIWGIKELLGASRQIESSISSYSQEWENCYGERELIIKGRRPDS